MNLTEKPKATCLSCEIKFIPGPCTKGMYCDKRCKSRAQRKMVKVSCKGCQKPMWRHASEIRRTESSVCSHECRRRAAEKDREMVVSLRKLGMSFKDIGKWIGCGKNKATYLYRGIFPGGEKVKVSVVQ